MNIHPSKQQLLDYCEGALNDVDGFTIALHLEQCSECRRLVSELEHRCADSVFNAEPVNDPSLVSDESFKNMLSTITDMEPTGASAFITPTRHNATVTTPNGKTFQLPSPLSRHAERISDWKNYGGKSTVHRLN
ncbi:putative transcriptional activator ChrR [Vibrio astriarenae]|nr:putative transcriptional activator ChrR [Vibrio sp. C7]